MDYSNREAKVHASKSPSARLAIHVCNFQQQERSFRDKIRTCQSPFYWAVPAELREGVAEDCSTGYDILHIEELEFGSLGFGKPHSVVSAHFLRRVDFRRTGFRSLNFIKHKILAAYGEREVLRGFSHIRVLTERMGREVREVNRRANVFTIPISLEASAYRRIPARDGELTVGLIGHMRMENSVRAARRLLLSIWPLVRSQVSDARLILAGWYAREALRELSSEDGVEIWENLRDPSEFFQRCTVLAYPLSLGAGLHGKILEAMAYGVPVVASTAGMEGIQAISGTHALIADDDDRFANCVVELLENPILRDRIATAGRSLVETEYSPEHVISQLEEVYRRIHGT